MIGWIVLGVVLLLIIFIAIRVISNMQGGNSGEGGFISAIKKTVDDCCGSLRGE